jgi:hypothetical protein
MPTARQQPETRDVLNPVLRYLATQTDVLTFRIHTGAARTDSGRVIRFGVVGSADIWCILTVAGSGRSVFIETKTEMGRQSEQQRNFEASVLRHGAVYILARSVDDVAAGLDGARISLATTMEGRAAG